MARKTFLPARPYGKQFPGVNPESFDPTQSIFIPERSIFDAHVAPGVSPRKLQGIGIKVYRDSTQAISNGADEDITFNSVDFNEGFQDPGATFTVVTVPYSGAYAVIDVIEWASDSVGARSNRLMLNGSQVERDVRAAQLASTSTVSAIRSLAPGDEVGISVRQTSGGNLNVSNGVDNCALTVVFLFPL